MNKNMKYYQLKVIELKWGEGLFLLLVKFTSMVKK